MTVHKLLVAWSVGWIVYMVALVRCCFDGLMFIVVQSVLGAVFSAVYVGMALLALRILRHSPVRVAWTWRHSSVLALLRTLLMLAGANLGLSATWEDEVSPRSVGLHPVAFLLLYGLLMTALISWPTKQAEVGTEI